MSGPTHHTEKEIHEGTRTLQEIAEAVEAERRERRERQEGFGQGMKHLGVDLDPNSGPADASKRKPRRSAPGAPPVR